MKKFFSKNNLFVLLVFTFIIGGLVYRNYKLKSVPFYDWDEGIYAEVSREMLRNHSLITTFDNKVWLNKPPLSYILISSSFLIFGESEFFSRFVFVVLASLILIFTYLLNKKIIKTLFNTKILKLRSIEREFLYLVPVIVTASTWIIIQRSTMLNTDLLVTLAWLGYFLFYDSFVGKLTFTFLGVLSKSLLGFYPLLLDSLFVFFNSFSLKKIVRILLIFLVSSLWYVFMYLKFGNFFIKAHFFDQILKRVISPIELHFGGRLFYLWFFVKNFQLWSIFILLSYAFMGISLFNIFKKGGLGKILKFLDVWIVYLTPIPFFALLVFAKSKIGWYLTYLVPFFALTLSYLVLELTKFKRVLLSLYLLITLYSLSFFMRSTYLLKVKNEPSMKVQLAKCIHKVPYNKVVFLVDNDERKIKNVLEAAHLQTATSFMYGGSPSFVFYVDKHVDYFYDVEKFYENLGKYRIAAVSKEDFKKNKFRDYNNVCSFGKWMGFIKNK